MAVRLDHLGKGIEYPFRFEEKNGNLVGLSDSAFIDQVNQSIHLILSTRIGERLMRPDFGSKLRDLIFEPLDEILYDLLELHTATALQKWEPRIEITVVSIDEANIDQGRIGIIIQYKIRGTSIVGNYVYPFESQTRPVTD